MPWSVGNIPDHGITLSKLTDNGPDDFEIGSLIMAANIIDVTNFAVMNNPVNSAAMIFDIEPVPDVFAFTVDRQLLIAQRIGNHQRDKLLREMIRTIIIRAPGDRYRNLKCTIIALRQKIGRRL